VSVRTRGYIKRLALPGRARRLGGLSRWVGPPWLWGLFFVVVVVATFSSEYFLTSANLTNVMRQSVPLGIVAVGQTLVILVAGIDISVAATISLANTMLMGIVNGDPSQLPVAIVAVLLAGAIIGVVNGLATVFARVPPFIVTLGTASIIQGITFFYTDQTTFGRPAPQMTDLGYANVGPFPVLFLFLLVIVVVVLVVQNRTTFGRYLFAVGGSEEIARISGIATRKVRVLAYTACGVLAVVAGMAMSTRMGAGEPLSGVGFDWDSIAAVVIGGTVLSGGKGGVGGTLGGVAVIGILNNTMNLLAVSPFLQIVVKGLIVLVAVVLSALSIRRTLRGRAARSLRYVGAAEA
jgi:ribose/xylose/arabinose/galactoside ABC-type transport system permease subunit